MATKKRTTGSTSTKKKTTSTTGTRKPSTSSRGRRSAKKVSSTNTEDIIIIITIALGVLTFISNFNLCGPASIFFNIFTFGLFGALGYVSPVLFVLFMFFLVFNRKNSYVVLKLIGALMIFVLVCNMAWLISFDKLEGEGLMAYYNTSMDKHIGGGIVGGLLVCVIHPVFQNIGTWLIFIVVTVILLLAVTEFSLFGYMGYLGEKLKDNRDTGREIKQMRAEETQRIREEALEENRRRNAQKMLDARMKLEEQRADSDGIKREPEYVNDPKFKIERTRRKNTGADNLPKGDIENPLKPVLGKNLKKKDDYVVDVETGEIIEDKKQDDPLGALTEIINREVHKNDKKKAQSAPEPVSVDDIKSVSNVKQTKVSDIEKSDTEEKYINGMPARKPFPELEPEEEKIIETASGKIIRAEIGNTATKKVEAEGHESDPHGTGAKYDDDEEEIKVEAPAKEYVFPPINLLTAGAYKSPAGRDLELKNTAEKLVETLNNFNVKVSISNIVCGPAVTRYELTPELGVKISKIVSLQDDIKLSLAASDIRIEAPIPGKSAIGIEVPNKENSAVNLRDIIESDAFKNASGKLAFACGKDIGGQNIVGDIAKMPHLLIAGATGSGKSVCINTIIVSILYHAKPSEVRLIMIDPKVVELKVYNNIPHLLRPVVTDAKQAAGALSWAVGEMTRRYEAFAKYNVRDLKGYNEKVREKYKGKEDTMPKNAIMPQIVIIVDELADLMMVAPGEVEDSILHLAQMARAAGMHLILATQRPSVNVITGVIKANIPSRIAFSVSSGVDSRTIIDMIGAEKLLGKGDMLYFPQGLQKPIRVQGAFVSDKEVEQVVDFVVNQGDVKGGGYDNNIDLTANAAMTDGQAGAQAASGNDENDPLFNDAAQLIVSVQKASIGMLQRKFRIGFNRAARIMDQLSEAGIVGEEEGTKPRGVLMTQEELDEFLSNN
ncbi:MAG: DNA translocase FtsK 4TM domain-containing protein [Lachnospiraceae bacterium]|nr:DNA translocase FtsK 4TM domain-containing protein [Lachnospiraceae bacterium]